MPRLRKGKRFTAQKLAKWAEKGRGQGRGARYQPWHKIGRDDPASRGRSHVERSAFGNHERHRHLLSDNELIALMFVWRLGHVVDVLEQFPLSLASSEHVLARYHAAHSGRLYPGTQELAAHLGIKHPVVSDGDRRIPEWVMTTDLVAVFQRPGSWDALAISVKPHAELRMRTKELLQLEREYWVVRGVCWRLLVINTISRKRRDAILSLVPFVVRHQRPDDVTRAAVVAAVGQLEGVPIARAVYRIAAQMVVSQEQAKALFWQCVWLRDIPVSLDMAFGRGFVHLDSVTSVSNPLTEDQ